MLLVGRGGSGKSCTTAACLGTPLRFASDDYCVVNLDDQQPSVTSVYSTLKLGEADAGLIASVRYLPSTLYPRSGKRLFHLVGIEPSPLVEGFPIRAIALPSVVARRDTRVHRVSAGQAMRALAPSTLFQIPGLGRHSFELMARLVRAVPAYRLELGSDRPGVVRALTELLESNS